MNVSSRTVVLINFFAAVGLFTLISMSLAGLFDVVILHAARTVREISALTVRKIISYSYDLQYYP